MGFLGFYSKKEIEEIEYAAIKIGFADGEAKTKKDMDKKIEDIRDESLREKEKVQKEYGSIIGNMLADQTELEKKLACSKGENIALKALIESESDKEIKRLEVIKKRTKKSRIKKKCENRIITYQTRKLICEKE